MSEHSVDMWTAFKCLSIVSVCELVQGSAEHSVDAWATFKCLSLVSVYGPDLSV